MTTWSLIWVIVYDNMEFNMGNCLSVTTCLGNVIIIAVTLNSSDISEVHFWFRTNIVDIAYQRSKMQLNINRCY